ncbi:MAG: YigZ family protein [Anaerolineales bacterium]|nr:YigZ family protein [Anaerolineales bacterium]
MSQPYPIPAGEARIELQVKNSRFIGRAGYTPSVATAKAFIEKVKAEEPGCTHAVYAFAVGHGATVTHGMSDAGEPSGTAGRPALAVVKGSGLGDVTIVIVRYFGGTKLGTGGLVKAYTETAQAVLAELPLTEKVERRSVQVTLSYASYESVKRMVAAHQGQVDAEEFATQVTLRLTFSADDLPAFQAALAETTSGQVTVESWPI